VNASPNHRRTDNEPRAGADGAGLAGALSRLSEGLSRLISQHLELARAELTHAARTYAKEAAGLAVFVPLVLVGYVLLCAAAAAALAGPLGLPWALALVGAVNLGVGGGGAAWVASRMKGQTVLDESRTEVGRSVSVLKRAAGKDGPRLEG
jgi:hypothetical protein